MEGQGCSAAAGPDGEGSRQKRQQEQLPGARAAATKTAIQSHVFDHCFNSSNELMHQLLQQPYEAAQRKPLANAPPESCDHKHGGNFAGATAQRLCTKGLSGLISSTTKIKAGDGSNGTTLGPPQTARTISAGRRWHDEVGASILASGSLRGKAPLPFAPGRTATWAFCRGGADQQPANGLLNARVTGGRPPVTGLSHVIVPRRALGEDDAFQVGSEMVGRLQASMHMRGDRIAGHGYDVRQHSAPAWLINNRAFTDGYEVGQGHGQVQ